jgi:hypothetical protein
LFFAIMLVGGLTGCAGFGEYLATDPDGPGPQVSPMAQAGSDMAGSLSAFEEGGIIAGIVALVLTAGKTGLRLYSGWRAAKAAKEGATP